MNNNKPRQYPSDDCGYISTPDGKDNYNHIENVYVSKDEEHRMCVHIEYSPENADRKFMVKLWNHKGHAIIESEWTGPAPEQDYE